MDLSQLRTASKTPDSGDLTCRPRAPDSAVVSRELSAEDKNIHVMISEVDSRFESRGCADVDECSRCRRKDRLRAAALLIYSYGCQGHSHGKSARWCLPRRVEACRGATSARASASDNPDAWRRTVGSTGAAGCVSASMVAAATSFLVLLGHVEPVLGGPATEAPPRIVPG